MSPRIIMASCVQRYTVRIRFSDGSEGDVDFRRVS